MLDKETGILEETRTAVRPDHKIVPLEGLRGLAALTVVVGHFCGAFFLWWPTDLNVLNFTTNGVAAVSVFFVLSGFVLGLPYLERGDDAALIRSGIKRWPRLVGPVLTATLFSCALFKFHLYRNVELGAFLHNPWATAFGGTNPDGSFTPTWGGAFRDGIFSTFFSISDHYNVVLWTMYHEMMGSFLVFALVFGLRRANLIGALCMISVAIIFAFYWNPRLYSFIAGTTLAYAIINLKPRFNIGVAAALVVVAIYLFGYSQAIGDYAWLKFIEDSGPWRYDQMALGSTAGVFFIVALTCNPTLRSLCSGRFFAQIGRLSFPIYLYHIPLIFGFAAPIFLWLSHHGMTGIAPKFIAGATAFPVLIAVTLLAARIDDAWLIFINSRSKRLLGRPLRVTETAIVRSPQSANTSPV